MAWHTNYNVFSGIPQPVKDENAKSDDKVTLKKEIGLLSACAIIIGESTSNTGLTKPPNVNVNSD
uniref:Uncharacterized protein n=1 Tax=Xiphophorus couchianus TaxID=32473 RepID=A0A3B5MWE6_9TELE